MAKISPVSIKYMIYASFKAEGPLEKPDVIGAVFGQTEGLLGNDLEMRELQKEGKIGRIEVELENVDGKSIGEIQIPSALSKSETTLIAAALETIDRIGPTEAEITIAKIKDVRASKREFIMERAKGLLDKLEGGDVEEMSQLLKEESRISKVQEYGEEKLPAGDLSGKEIIVVEGRADVVNLLRHRVNNVIGMNGTKLPLEIAKLGEEKELTLFIDGDRGGKLIAKNVINNANISYIAIAPDGKEVEELAGKEILMAIRRKIPVREYRSRELEGNFREKFKENDVSGEDAKKKLREIYSDVKGSKSALLVDSNFDVIKKVPAREAPRNISNSKRQIFSVVLEGTATIALIRACDEKGVSYLAATNFGRAGNTETSVGLISL